MGIWERCKNLLVPDSAYLDEEDSIEDVAEQAEENIRVANGGSPYVEADSGYDNAVRAQRMKPRFTVHTNEVGELAVRIHVPTSFDDVRSVADDLIAKRAALVNFERVEGAERCRICDFANGACYVLEGEAKRISDVMILYVPAGVDVSTL
ncbi:MAG: cell division protein SepF [Selenomonadaceae bacterium]